MPTRSLVAICCSFDPIHWDGRGAPRAEQPLTCLLRPSGDRDYAGHERATPAGGQPMRATVPDSRPSRKRGRATGLATLRPSANQLPSLLRRPFLLRPSRCSRFLSATGGPRLEDVGAGAETAAAHRRRWRLVGWFRPADGRCLGDAPRGRRTGRVAARTDPAQEMPGPGEWLRIRPSADRGKRRRTRARRIWPSRRPTRVSRPEPATGRSGPVQLEQARQLGDRVGHRIDKTTGDGLWHQHSLRAQPLQEHDHRRGIGYPRSLHAHVSMPCWCYPPGSERGGRSEPLRVAPTPTASARRTTLTPLTVRAGGVNWSDRYVSLYAPRNAAQVCAGLVPATVW